MAYCVICGKELERIPIEKYTESEISNVVVFQSLREPLDCAWYQCLSCKKKYLFTIESFGKVKSVMLEYNIYET